MIPMLSSLITPLIEKAVAFIPDPEAKAKARAELHAQMQSSEDSFRNFVVEYEGRGDQVHPFVQIYRSSVRPTVTYGLIIAFCAAIWSTKVDDAVITMLFKLNLLTLSFWFGSKALERLGINGKSMKGMLKK